MGHYSLLLKRAPSIRMPRIEGQPQSSASMTSEKSQKMRKLSVRHPVSTCCRLGSRNRRPKTQSVAQNRPIHEKENRRRRTRQSQERDVLERSMAGKAAPPSQKALVVPARRRKNRKIQRAMHDKPLLPKRRLRPLLCRFRPQLASGHAAELLAPLKRKKTLPLFCQRPRRANAVHGTSTTSGDARWPRRITGSSCAQRLGRENRASSSSTHCCTDIVDNLQGKVFTHVGGLSPRWRRSEAGLFFCIFFLGSPRETDATEKSGDPCLRGVGASSWFKSGPSGGKKIQKQGAKMSTLTL